MNRLVVVYESSQFALESVIALQALAGVKLKVQHTLINFNNESKRPRILGLAEAKLGRFIPHLPALILLGDEVVEDVGLPKRELEVLEFLYKNDLIEIDVNEIEEMVLNELPLTALLKA